MSSWTDADITTRENDRFGRRGYANRAAGLIASSRSWDDSAVFGLSGQWGSGKTSLMNMIAEALLKEEQHKDLGYKIVRFTPWATHDVTGVLGDFYSSIASTLPQDRREEVQQKMAGLLRVAAPAAKLIPFAGEATSGIAALAAEKLVKTDPWDVAFGKAVAALKANGSPILVIVDDIDRLQGDELLCVLKVIRLLGRFPGVQYLLAYDQEALAHSLWAASAVRDVAEGRRYIEKIVQYPLLVPPLLEAQLTRELQTRMSEVIRAHRTEVPTAASMRRVTEARPIMQTLLTTPRAIGRYIALLNYDLGIHAKGEVDDQDVIVLALLRVAFPSIYDALPLYQDRLITGTPTGIEDGETTERWDAGELLKGVTDTEQPQARDLLQILFPKLRHHAAIATRPRIGTRAYFGRYFAMGILEDFDVADADVEAAVTAAIDGSPARLSELLLAEDSELGLLAFDKMRHCFDRIWSRTPEDSRDDITHRILTTLLPIVKSLEGGVFFSYHDVAASWIGNQLLALFPPSYDSSKLIAALNTTDDLLVRMTVLRYANRGAATAARPWLRDIYAEMLPSVRAEFISHLQQRDNAQDRCGHLTEFFKEAHFAGISLDSVRNAIIIGLTANEFSLGDLAARFVYTILGDRMQVDQEGFNRVAPSAHDPWYEASPTPIDESVDTWQNRRKFAAGRLTCPPLCAVCRDSRLDRVTNAG